MPIVTNQELSSRVVEVETRLRAVEGQVSDLRSEVATKEDVRRVEASMEDLLEAWRTAGGMFKFVKWAAGIGAALASFGAAVIGLLVAFKKL